MSSQTNVLRAIPWKATLDELGEKPSSELFIKAIRLFIGKNWNVSLLEPLARTLTWDELGTDEFGNLLNSFAVEFVEAKSAREPSEGTYTVDPERAKQGAELAAKLNSTVLIPAPLAEMSRIVAKVDDLMILCDSLESSLATGDAVRSRLLNRLLHDALAECSQVNDDAVEALAN